MTYRSLFAGIPWVCVVCDGGEISAPGDEPPSPPICPSCVRLQVSEVLATLEVAP
ncbi:hypothetical protein [Nonomuraea soli]|uniref:Uncharacterized protein n=1 Tax=Nonomuraea soli TaxID=1032476 RepID=A0A7W0CT15_9ACTN|nr:hypothetical protein [Nonomuraea soli]MBA2896639.1 hypothetical protein [Nonomuraea soli]